MLLPRETTEICGCVRTRVFGCGRALGRVCGGTYEEEPLGQEAVSGWEVGCERAHCVWVYALAVCTSVVFISLVMTYNGGVFNGWLINSLQTLVYVLAAQTNPTPRLGDSR